MQQKKKRESNPIVTRIIDRYDPEKIILFGSRARGTASASSDYDLIVVAKTKLPFAQRLRAIAVLKTDVHMNEPSDILMYSPKEFAAMSKRWNPFFHRIRTEGKVIYDRAYARHA